MVGVKLCLFYEHTTSLRPLNLHRRVQKSLTSFQNFRLAGRAENILLVDFSEHPEKAHCTNSSRAFEWFLACIE